MRYAVCGRSSEAPQQKATNCSLHDTCNEAMRLQISSFGFSTLLYLGPTTASLFAMLLSMSFLQGLHASLNSSSPSPITSFNVTAISALHSHSVLQCWQITEPLAISAQAGVAGAVFQSLGDAVNVTWGSLPAHYPGSPHPAPQVQYVFSRLQTMSTPSVEIPH